MSGHNHSRQPNTNWDSLQIPTYIPRQPQLAHMSSERSIVRSPLTWHTPTPTDGLYSYIANNHKNPLELNPLLPSFNLRPTSPLGSVDLSISGAAKSSSSASPINVSGSVNKCLSKSPTPSVIQSTVNIKDRSTNSSVENTTGGGLIIKDAKQINNDVDKLTRGDIKLPSSPEAILRMKNNASPIKSPKQHSPNENSISNSKNICNKPPSDIIIEINSNKSLLHNSPINSSIHHIPTTVAASTPISVSNSSDISNISNNSNEDTVDSNSGKKRRRRKPNKTTRMTNENDILKYSEHNTDDEDVIKTSTTLIAQKENNNLLILNGQTNDEKNNINSEKIPDKNMENGDCKNDKIQNPNNNHNSNSSNDINKLEINNKISVTDNVVLDDKTQRNEKQQVGNLKQDILSNVKSLNSRTVEDSDECETIDKIAEMISSTCTEADQQIKLSGEPDETKKNLLPPSVAEHSTEQLSLAPKLNGVQMNEKFEDVENKLEEMFAGIEEKDETKIENKDLVSLSLPVAEINETNVANVNNQIKKCNKRKIVNGKDESGSSARKKKVLNKKGGKNVNSKSAGKNSKKNGSKFSKSYNSTKTNAKDDTQLAENGLSLNKYRGPFVQVKLDGTLNIINAPINEDDTDKPQNKIKKSIHSSNSERNKIRGMHVSTLSMKYDADTTDASWMCVYCKMGPHKSNLGDLFGPYIVTTNCEEFKASQCTTEDLFNVKRTTESMISKHCVQKINESAGPSSSIAQPKKKRKLSEIVKNANDCMSSTVANIVIPNNNVFYGMTKVDETSYEVWLHEDCAVWAPGVHIIGARIVGINESIWESCKHKCSLCLNYGAMLTCLKRGCLSAVHIACARKNKWNLTDEFKSYCEQHKEQS